MHVLVCVQACKCMHVAVHVHVQYACVCVCVSLHDNMIACCHAADVTMNGDT